MQIEKASSTDTRREGLGLFFGLAFDLSLKIFQAISRLTETNSGQAVSNGLYDLLNCSIDLRLGDSSGYLL